MTNSEPNKIIRKTWKTYNIIFGKHYETGLGDDMTIAEFPDMYLYFAHHTFSIEWNEITKKQEIIENKPTFYGGMGEGKKFSKWQDAVLASLYDAYQSQKGFNKGDIIIATYQGETANYVCDGIHVLLTD